MRTFINLALMHSTAASPLSIPATIDSNSYAYPVVPFSSCFPPSAPEQITTYPAAVKALCPLRLTSGNPMISQPASSQVFSITSAWPMPFVPLQTSVPTLYVLATSSPALDLALASVRIFRAALRNLLRLLLFLRASDSVPSTLRFSPTEYFPHSVSLRPPRFLRKCERDGGSSPDTPRPSPSRLDSSRVVPEKPAAKNRYFP